MNKRELAEKSVFLHNLLLKRFDARMELVFKEKIATKAMRYDTIDDASLRKEFDKYKDYTRYRTFELIADEIRKKYSPDELSNFCIAEAGVYKGEFAWIINEKFPECEMYLYDTFEGFDKNDLTNEVNHSYTEERNIKSYVEYYGNPAESSEQRIEAVKSKLKYKGKCHIRKGYFPESAEKEKDKHWVFVSLDMDLYQPMKEGLFYFWPNMVEGGYIFAHDYNNKDFAGIKQAVLELEQEFGRIYKIPISDEGGTIILCK